MDIDKFYRSVGTMFKRAWNQFVKRPVKNFNVEDRAYKAIEKKKAAPWHDTTKQMIDQIKKENAFEKYNKYDNKLADRLKSVKVVSTDVSIEETHEDDSKRKLPQERYGANLPYVFYKPENVPRGKLTVLDALDVMINLQKGNTTPKEVSSQYGISEEDIAKIIRYVDVFKAVGRNKEEIQLYSLEDEEKLQLERPKLDKVASEK